MAQVKDNVMRNSVLLVEGGVQTSTGYIAAGGDDDDFQELDVPEPEDISSNDEGAQPAAQDPAVTADGKTKKKRKKAKVSQCILPAVSSVVKHGGALNCTAGLLCCPGSGVAPLLGELHSVSCIVVSAISPRLLARHVLLHVIALHCMCRGRGS